jgi:hypothetical protein
MNRPGTPGAGKHWQGFKWSGRRATAMHVAKWTYGYEKGIDVPIEATVFMPMPGADPCGRIRGQSALGVTARRCRKSAYLYRKFPRASRNSLDHWVFWFWRA